MSQKEIQVGVVIPVYNRPKLVLDTLDSVARQTVLPDKLIIVDDGSTDDTAISIQEWIDNLKIPINTQLISIENRGLGGARNCGMQYLDGCQLVSFLDSDDRWPENFIARMTKRLIDEPKAVAVTSDGIYLNLKTMVERFDDCSKIPRDPIDFIIRYGAGFTSSTFFRMEKILACDGYDDTLRSGEDAEMMLRLALLGPWLHEPGDSVIYTIHSHIKDEEEHLGWKYSDGNYLWANIYDSFLSTVNNNLPKRKQWVKILVRRWCRIGLVYLAQLNFSQARYCFSRAIHWKKNK
jgi:glycosyltransferase involved in cell wall biosynthesis